MMFGHDDQQNDQSNTAMPDGTLSQDQDATTALPPVPAAPTSDDALTAPDTQDTAAGDFMVNDATAAQAVNSGQASDEDLLQIKQQALQQLSPLLGHLDQTPEEKFRTTMMLIQASDNDSLIPHAYEAAKAIQDEKARAQALLDVVNEINYFTQQSDTSTDQ